MSKGILVAIEGIDGAGKTTQVNMLHQYYKNKGLHVAKFKEPTDGKYGQMIRGLAKNGRDNISPEYELELFIEDRKEDCEINIKPALDQKKLVIIDRYFISSVAYQGALGLDPKYILKENEKIAIIPDIVIILDCAVNIGLRRIQYSRGDTPNHFEKEDALEKSRQIFQQLQAPYIQLIDSTPNEEVVFSNIKNIMNSIMSPYLLTIREQQDLFGYNYTSKKFEINSN